LRLMKKVHIEYPDLPIVIVSGQEDVKRLLICLRMARMITLLKIMTLKTGSGNLINKLRRKKTVKY